ncbi:MULTISPECIES: GTP cyclohydrolase I [unclassified Leifsonia]|uniref:GTP cyclohydrolase I n=1 Tax=unclassified Leifsonia TaxID=2663824 RepID=UPI0008A7ACC1|nr:MULTISPECIES: GTP cyclohydrolase I [unclassified Leifsonia]SEI13595.1 GTP cyclohydrolase I [Leifsonia sp. CL154]SFL99319.1 GTP cyclohydrolase I [Leifsonia sp. CL147]
MNGAVHAVEMVERDERAERPEGPELHAVTSPGRIDAAAAEKAAAQFLTALGVPLESEHLHATPGRMARAWAEMLTPRPFEMTTFPNDEGYDELVVARDIPVRSLCEHHLLPFTGRAWVAYLPGDRILGLSKLARVVELFACRPQTQERLTKQVADWLQEQLQPRAVGVVIAAEHSCMTLRGANAVGSSTVTSTLLGSLRDDPRSRAEFLAVTGIAS